eukprot:scaffold254967_cov22-Prasinocladus_malaysianus.AAC.1
MGRRRAGHFSRPGRGDCRPGQPGVSRGESRVKSQSGGVESPKSSRDSRRPLHWSSFEIQSSSTNTCRRPSRSRMLN